MCVCWEVEDESGFLPVRWAPEKGQGEEAFLRLVLKTLSLRSLGTTQVDLPVKIWISGKYSRQIFERVGVLPSEHGLTEAREGAAWGGICTSDNMRVSTSGSDRRRRCGWGAEKMPRGGGTEARGAEP